VKDDKVEAPALADKVESPIDGVQKEVASPSDAAEVNKVAKEELSAANKQPEVKPAFNPETSHKELIERYTKQERSYKELQKHATQQSMKAAELEKKLDKLLTSFEKATQVEIDPQQFIRDVNERGHAPIVELIGKEVEKVRNALIEENGKITSAQETKIYKLEADLLIERMGRDTKNFPGFDEMKEKFGEILDDPECPVREDLPIFDQLQALYNIAKTRSADTAVILAKEEGKKEAENQLAKEAKAHTAGGGKTAGTTEPDWDNMPLDKHRKLLIDTFGIRE